MSISHNIRILLKIKKKFNQLFVGIPHRDSCGHCAMKKNALFVLKNKILKKDVVVIIFNCKWKTGKH